MLLQNSYDRSSHKRCSIMIGVLRNFPKFTGKHLCHSLFFNKVAGLRLQVFSKFAKICEFCEISKNTFYYRTPLVAAMIRFWIFYFSISVSLIEKNSSKQKYAKFSNKTRTICTTSSLTIKAITMLGWLFIVCSKDITQTCENLFSVNKNKTTQNVWRFLQN